MIEDYNDYAEEYDYLKQTHEYSEPTKKQMLIKKQQQLFKLFVVPNVKYQSDQILSVNLHKEIMALTWDL